MPKPHVSHLAQQAPGVFTEVRADGGQQQGLSLDELEDKVPVHSLNSQLTVLIFGCLHTHKKQTNTKNILKRSSSLLLYNS